ncbi:GH36-type glycosyl hydrolase domain-containing protein [Spirosoma arcticum]
MPFSPISARHSPFCTRVTFSCIVCLLYLQTAYCQKIGTWAMSAKGLPVYRYTGAIPFTAADKDGVDANLPEDPYFLLGNYRVGLLTHASGRYQLLTAERAWARLNADEQTNYGWNDASIRFGVGQAAKRVNLIGVNSLAADPALTQKSFGVGMARYTYQLPQVRCTRTLSVKPSPAINQGNPAFVVTVTLSNTGTQTQQLTYIERIRVNFVLNGTQYTDPAKRPLLYRAAIGVDAKKQLAIADIHHKANAFLVTPTPTERYPYDVDPPSVFMWAGNTGSDYQSAVRATNDTLATTVNATLKPGQTVRFNLVVGLTKGNRSADVDTQVTDLLAGATVSDPSEGMFVQQWKAKLPDLSAEKNEILKREMLWNAHFVEASAKYSAYYDETFIPQGTVYSYYFGDNISNRDHLQAALPACYTNPALAKSILRYVLKHTEADGEIKRGNAGFGYTAPSIYKESDEQLFFFYVLSEYLTITKDYSFLNESVAYYPAELGKKETVLTMLKKQFIYLRDEIGVGPNGLVRMLNSDWSDSFFHDYSPNVYAGSAESHLNSVVVVATFPRLIDGLQKSRNAQATPLITALNDYRAAIEQAYMRDLGDRNFSARAYLSRKLKFGVDNVCLEPQGYLLQVPGLPTARKKAIYEYVKSKVLAPEKIGIRTRERSLWGRNPDGEDGGIWFSLEYPVLLGVATFDKAEAWSLLTKFSFHNYAQQYPDYWVGQWTAADEVNSTLYREGLYAFWVPSQDRKRAFQGYCSHPHTWPLFCYFKLNEP